MDKWIIDGLKIIARKETEYTGHSPDEHVAMYAVEEINRLMIENRLIKETLIKLLESSCV